MSALSRSAFNSAARSFEDACESAHQSRESLAEDAAEIAEANLRARCTVGNLISECLAWETAHPGKAIDDFVSEQRRDESELWTEALELAFDELQDERSYA